MGPDDLRSLRRTVVALGYEQNESEARSFLQHEDSVVRELALGALHRMQALTDADLALALRDDDRLVRRRVAELGALFPGVDLAPLLADLEPVVVEMAVWAYGEREQVDDNTLQTIISLSERLETSVECPQSSGHAETNRRCDDGPFSLSLHFPVQRSRQQSIPLSPIVIGKYANQRRISDANCLAVATRRLSPVTFARR
jgi:hypothetical protein